MLRCFVYLLLITIAGCGGDDVMPEPSGEGGLLDATLDATTDALVMGADANDGDLGPDAMRVGDASTRTCVVDPDCDDENACTEDDCVMGLCAYRDRSCRPTSRCQVGRCDPAMGCLYDVMPDCPGPPAAPPGCTATTNTFSQMPALSVVQGTERWDRITVPSMAVGSYLWNVSVITHLRHTFSGDVAMQVNVNSTSVYLVEGGASAFDDVYNGTRWDDRADLLSTGYRYRDGEAATPLVPAEALSRLRGIDANQRWMLRVVSRAAALPMMEMGTLDAWELHLTTLGGAPRETTTMYSSTAPVDIRDFSTGSSPLTVAGAPAFICQIEVSHTLMHGADSQLDLALISPTGTRVILSRRRGVPVGEFADIRWTDMGPRRVTDEYWKLRSGSGLIPEGALGAFLTEDPNGTWYLEVQDRVAETEGTLTDWSLHLTTCRCD